jgi:hypothetical protein
MPKRVLYLILAIALVACKKEKTEAETETENPAVGEPASVSMQQNTTWTTIPFKTNYTIQFPLNYTGVGMAGFEGNVFTKRRDDTTVVFKYTFCNGLRCNDFGGTLKSPAPATVEYRNGNLIVPLDKRLAFHNADSQRVAILYYVDWDYALGKLYWKENGEFREALDIMFTKARYPEVVEILKTIKRK